MEKKNLIGLPLTCFLVLSLLMAACAPAPRTTPGPTTQTAPAAPTARTTTVPAEKPAVTPSAQKPKYGGVLKLGKSADIIYFDEVVGVPYSVPTFALTNQNLVEGDWTKGPAGGYGTNETGWGDRLDRWEHKTGFLAENWKLEATPEMGTLTLNIRKGVRWALNPDSEASRLVNGREMTADDVVFSLKTYLTDKRSFIYRSHTLDMVKSFAEGQLKITTPDQWTVKIEMPTAQLEAGVGRFIDNARIVPREVLEKWGANAMADWKKSVGTGPFILTEFTSGSSATLVKNPNFWMKNPVGPGKGDKLPYLDGVKFLIITDKSTYFAALRTAKVDWLGAVNWEDAKELKVSAKQVVSKEYDIGGGNGLYMVSNSPPFDDKRVRRAMMMAIDFEAVKKNYFGGRAYIVTWPITYQREYAAAYLDLDDPEMPSSVKELYSYNPEKAKALLKEAGYPQGFKTNAIITNTTEEVDYWSLYKDYWAKIGVEMELRPMETGAYTASIMALRQTQMSTTHQAPTSILYRMVHYRGPGYLNAGKVNDPYVNETHSKLQWLAVTDRAAADRMHKELMKYVLDQAWAIPKLVPPGYNFWWPWVKNYSGEKDIGYNNADSWSTYVWYDEDLKKSMGY